MKYLLLCLFITGQVLASERFETKSHREILSFIKERVAQLQKNSDILVVYDIDNTLLKMKRNFGSDQWFGWQNTCLKVKCPELVVQDFPGLIEFQNDIYALSSMELVEPELTNIIKTLQSEAVSVIGLTSRGPEVRNATQRELERNGINLKKTAMGSPIGHCFIPTGQDRLASYQSGIFMTSGMHKGKMLRYLLKRFKSQFKIIIFVDDLKKHTERVFEEFKSDSETQIYTFRYGRQDEAVEAFLRSNKIESIRLAKMLSTIRRLLR